VCTLPPPSDPGHADAAAVISIAASTHTNSAAVSAVSGTRLGNDGEGGRTQMNLTWAERMADGSVDSVDKGSGRQIVTLGVGSAALGGRALTLTEPRARLGSGEMSEEEFLPRFPSTLIGGMVLLYISGPSKACVKGIGNR
jgi:hypothetical protein